jgi:hypothetical protein
MWAARAQPLSYLFEGKFRVLLFLRREKGLAMAYFRTTSIDQSLYLAQERVVQEGL